MYSFFWVLPRRMYFMCQRFGTLRQVHLHRWCRLTQPMKMELTECSETSTYKIQKPGNHPKERIQHTEHGESLKSRRKTVRNRQVSITHSIRCILNLSANM